MENTERKDIETIEQYFLKQGFNFSQSIHRNTYLPIERFSDDTYDKISDEQVIQMLRKDKIPIFVMEQSGMGDWFWYRAHLTGYSKLFHYSRKSREGRCARIHFIMDFEDRLTYMKKLQRAVYLRDQMDRQLKYNCYIENMPTNDLVIISNQQAKRIKRRIGFEYPKQWVLREFMEANALYLKTQNSIIFVHFLKNSETNSNLRDLLNLFKDQYQKPITTQQNMINNQLIFENGVLIQSISTSFNILKQSYTLASLCSIKQIQKCLCFINSQAVELQKVDLFLYQQEAYEKFRFAQEYQIKNTLSFLKGKWIQDIILACQNNLQIMNKSSQILNQIQLDRFFQLLRLRLQDVLYHFVKDNIDKFMNYLKIHIPEEILIQSYSQVQNVYIIKQSIIKPLFTIQVTLRGNQIKYNHSPATFSEYILGFFNEIYDKVGEIPDPETRLVDYFHKEFLYLINGNLKAPVKDDEYVKVMINQFQSVLKELDILNCRVKKSLIEYMKQLERFEGIIEDKPFLISTAQELIVANRHHMKTIEQVPDCMQIGAFLVMVQDLKQQLTIVMQKREQQYIEQLTKYQKDESMRLLDEYAKLECKIIEKPQNIEQLVEKRDLIENNLQTILTQLHQEVQQVRTYFDLINTVIESETVVQVKFYPIRREEAHKFYRLLLQEQYLRKLAVSQQELLEKQKQEIFELQSHDQKKFKKKLTQLSEMIDQFVQFYRLEESQQAESLMQKIDQLFSQYQSDAQKFNKREQLFGLPLTHYQMISELQCIYYPFATVWRVNKYWQQFYTLWIHEPIIQINYTSCESFFNTEFRQFIQIFDKIQDEQIYPLWKYLKKKIDDFQQYVPILLSLTKNNLRDRHFQYLASLVNISGGFTNIITFQNLIDLKIQNYKNECLELGILASDEFNIEQVLKNITDTWKKQIFNRNIVKGICIFKKLDTVQALVDDHLIQLEMIFKQKNNGYFINEITSLHEELKKVSSFLEEWNKVQCSILYLQPIFESQDSVKQLPLEYKKYRQIDKLYKELVGFSEKIFEFGKQDISRVRQINNLLDQIQKELGNYLERKKEKFSRFSFISNDEILEILSSGQDIGKIKKYLYKLFESIVDVKYNGQNQIHTLITNDCQLILNEFIDTDDKNVEDWLCELEQKMKETVKFCILREENSANQFSLLRLELNHTNRIDKDLREGKDLRIYQYELKNRLQQKNQHSTVILLLAHHLDVVNRLIDYDLKLVQFYWSLQLRYYIQDDQCVVNSLQASIQYGNEYLGNLQRIIITPLTERCLIIFLNAVHFKRGGAAVGQTGTGKTETIKDLCKATGQRCILFNCSELVDYVLISQFITGLSRSGCWSCFDEFNRITAEVLSVAASKLMEYQPDGMFVSMNPSYKGRTELPDNLKSYFRLASMIAPNTSIIISTLLYINGFQEPTKLTEKLLTLIETSKNLLSNQPHYDYSLRAIKSIITLAGSLYNKGNQINSLIKAIRYVFEPKLIQQDIEMFDNLLVYYFPSYDKETPNYQDCQSYIPTNALQQKVDELQLLIKIRHGIMIVGPAGQGKSTCLNLVTQTNNMTSIRIFPKAVKTSELFGCLNLSTLEWQEGILPSILKQDQKYQILIFDGAVETNWIETLNSALDESKRLCLTNGCILNLDSILVFEVDTLQGATPSTISRCAIIYVQDDPLLGVKSMINKLFSPEQAQNFINIIDQSINKLHNIKLVEFGQQMINVLQIVNKEYKNLNQQLFAYCLAWAILPSIENKQEKEKINSYLKNVGNIQCQNLIIYNIYNEEKNIFQLMNVPTNLKYTCFEDIYVPRLEEMAYLKQSQLLLQNCGLRFQGRYGSGKKNLMNQILRNFQYIRVNCSSSTTSSKIQLILESNLERRRKGVYGPQVGQNCIIVLDDFHMTQDSELMRQFLTEKGWYSKGDQQTYFHKVEDTNLLGIMNNQAQHSDRMIRLWSKFQFADDEDTYAYIFTQVAQIYQMQHIVDKTLEAYRSIKNSLKPTFNKIHYQFTMKDVWRVLQSMCTNKTQNEAQWNFEMARIFVDRLILKQDKVIAFQIIGIESYQFCNFSSGFNDRSYKCISDLELLLNIMKDQLIKYAIPVCEDILKSLIAISRILGLNQGHLVILGQVGTGGIQMCRLASFLNDYECPQVDRWRDDLRNIIKQCIVDNKKVSLLIDELKSSHNQIDVFQDINSLLNCGDLDIFNRKELEDLHSTFEDQESTHQQYVSKLKTNLHCLINLNSTMKFRNYPSLINGATIISLQQLPEQALISIAQMHLKYLDINSQSLCDLLKYFHQSAQLIDNHQKIQTVTSIHYSDLLELFKRVYQEKSTDLAQKINRLKTGLAKIQTANEMITELKQELIKITPEIEVAQQESSIMMNKLKQEKDQAYYQESLLSGDETQANIQQIQATKLAEEATQAVKEVNLLLEQTLADVQKLKKEHLVEIKSLGKPPKPVVIIITGVVILNLDNLKQMITQPLTQLANQDYFEIAKKYLLNDPKELLELIRNYDKNNINPYNINRLEKLVIIEPDFTFERARQCSAAVKYLYSWVKAMYEYNKVYIETKPLRERFLEAQRSLREKTEILNEKKNQLQIVLTKVKNLQEQYDTQIHKCDNLNQQLEDSTNKLKMAQSMTSGLSQEQQRWTAQIQQLAQSQKYLIGDCAVAAAYLNYCPHLNEQMRIQLLQQWMKQAKQKIGHESHPVQFLNSKNHIFLEYATKPVFCIDPQCQANTYIRNTYEIVLAHDQHSFELAISLKQNILIENINSIPEWLTEYLNEKPHLNQFLFITTMQYNFLMTSQNYSQFYVVDYQITKLNADELMLEQIINIQNPELYRQQEDLKQMEQQNEVKLKQIEESILSILNVQNIRDLFNDETLINQLSSSKKIFNEIQKAQSDYQIIQQDLKQTKQQYKQLSAQISDLYFISQDMQCLDYMYQFSLDWFKGQLRLVLENTINVKSIFTNFRLKFYLCLSRVLTEKHRLILAFLLAKQTLISVDQEDWQAFIGYSRLKFDEVEIPPNPFKWMNKANYLRIWTELHQLQMVTSKILLNDLEQIRRFYLSKQLDIQEIPHVERLTDIQQIYITKAIRPDYLIPLIKNFISKTLDFNIDQVEQIPLDVSFNESQYDKTILYVLQNNQDPMEQIKEFAIKNNFIKKMWTLSLGQGQGSKAEKMIREAAEQGLWIVIQNCHLHQQWLSELDKLVMIESHQDYRLWLTSKSVSTFPGRILQKCVKLTYNSSTEKYMGTDSIVKFHHSLQKRCKLGLLGFNKKYEFTLHDLQITQEQCSQIDEGLNIQSYIVSELHYGGHIVDQLDQITLNKLVCYHFIDKINLPNNNLTDVYLGEGEANEFTSNLLYKEFGEIESVTHQVSKTIQYLIENLPKQLTLNLSRNHKLDAFLGQEINSINQLLISIEKSLSLCKKIQAGESISNTSILEDIKYLKVPLQWQEIGFSTDKNLSSWFSELLMRYQWLSRWNDEGIPSAIQLSYLVHAKNFITYAKFSDNCLQRKTVYTILDSIQLEHITSPPQIGYYIYGITIQGAKWSSISHKLMESNTMLNEFPICYLNYKEEDEYQLFYNCPIYKLIDRQEMITYLPIPCDTSRDWMVSGVAAFININI